MLSPPGLLQTILAHELQKPLQCAARFLHDTDSGVDEWTYLDLLSRAVGVATRLSETTTVGDRVLLLYLPGLDFISAFLGCLLAKRIAVPAYLPRDDRSLLRLRGIMDATACEMVLCTSVILPRVARWLAKIERQPAIETTDCLVSTSDRMPADYPAEDSVAFLQFTSGSTGQPKGVAITHANLLHNQRVIAEKFQQNSEAVVVSWLPLHHDMGLIGCVLHPLYLGATTVLMPPSAFVRKPIRWLHAISQYRATISGGPNFAYDECVSSISDAEIETLDLRSWEVAFNGAEPIRSGTLKEFAARFRRAGFRERSFCPCYGLAESTLMVTAVTPDQEPVFSQADPSARIHVGCGVALGSEVVIADEKNRPIEGSNTGRIFVRGSSVAGGYWMSPKETSETFQQFLADETGPYLDTGDLGFIQNHCLFVTGRSKAVIIIRGQNFHAEDVERIALEAHSALRGARVAAFGVSETADEQIVLCIEISSRWVAEVPAIEESVRKNLAQTLGVSPGKVLFVRRGSIPRTSSGKIQRSQCKEEYLGNSLLVLKTLPETSKACSSPGDVNDNEVTAIECALTEVTGRQSGLISGLDSLDATKMALKLSELFQRSVRPDLVLAASSARTLAEQIRELPPIPPLHTGQAMVTRDDRTLSPLQSGIWRDLRLRDDPTCYHIPALVDLEYDLGLTRSAAQEAVIAAAFRIVLMRHSELRAVFHETAAGPVRTILAPNSLRFHIPVHETSEDELDILCGAEARKPFELHRGPLLRASLLHLAGRTKIFLVAHHLIADGYSLGIVLRELTELARAMDAGHEPGLPEAPQFHQHVWTGDHDRQLDANRSFWTERLAGLSAISLPRDSNRSMTDGSEAASASLLLTAEQGVHLRELARQARATPYALGLAVFLLLVHKISGKTEFILGVQDSGRDTEVALNIVGPLVKPLLLPVRIGTETKFMEFIRATAGNVRDVRSHSSISVADLVAENRARLPQLYFNGLDFVGHRFDCSILSLFRHWNTSILSDVNCYFGNHSGTYELRFDYRPTSFRSATVRFWLTAYAELLDQVITNPERPVEDFRLMKQGPRRSLQTRAPATQGN